VSPAPDAFDERSVDRDPYRQFSAWYADAEVATGGKAAAMVIATATAEGRPSARVVLLRGVDDRGFVFFTNYESRKAGELGENAHAAGLFYWPELDRQIRVEGPTTKIVAYESDAYFAQRPRGHQVGAWASPQSAPIADRATLQARFDEAEARFADDGAPVPRPDFWGGYRLAPETFEFWQNRTDRLHDRVRYTRRDDGWVIERLAP
jgi:pyridoxamine 5'-phosphate oxidase